MIDAHLLQADVAIVGGGMVGAALALGLAEQGFEVLLIEARPPALEWPSDSHDLRVSAITRASRTLFDNLGVWVSMAADRVTPYRTMRVWDQAGFGEIRFDASDVGEPDLGHIVENRVIQRVLWNEIGTRGQVRVLAPATLDRFEHRAEGVQLWLSDGKQARVPLLVAADGAGSRVRGMADIAVQGWDYDQHALVMSVRPEFGHGETAWQRFMPQGPLALLPLDRDLFSIVWSTAPQHAEALAALDDEGLGQALSAATEGRVGRITAAGPRAVFPLRLQHALAYTRPGLALVGDAAHVIHPLAGQGVNLGLLDAASLVDTLVTARAAGRPLGGMATLRRYERARKGDNLIMQFAMDGFKRLFSNDIPPLRWVRNLGLGAVDRAGPLKRLFAQTAMGNGAEAPSLIRPRYQR